jgi:hypothetical protein
MPTEPENVRKRKPANPLDEVIINDGGRTSANGKSCKVSTDTIAAGTWAPEATGNSPERTPRSLEMVVQTDLFHPHVVVVEGALYYLNRMGLTDNDEECDKVVSVGGCLALVLLVIRRSASQSPATPLLKKVRRCASSADSYRRQRHYT